MPYIDQGRRAELEDLAAKIYSVIHNSCTPGDLNYIFTLTAQAYVEARGKNYTHLNDVIGALESCKQEFYRRAVAPYEDEKITKNGDVYGL